MDANPHGEHIEDEKARNLARLDRDNPPTLDEIANSQDVAEPTPLPDPLPLVPALDPDLLPDPLRPWIEATADALQVPLEFPAVAALVALGGVIGRRCGIAVKRHEPWVEVPVLWGALIGRPTSSKSPALRPALGMLHQLEKDARVTFDRDHAGWEAEQFVSKAAREIARKKIHVALKAENKSSAKELALLALTNVSEPTESRLVTNDATVEKLGELLNENPNGLLQFRDELTGWLENLDRVGREGDRAFWLEAWNGKNSFTVDRIGRGTIHIEACAVSVLGGIQPGRLEGYVRQAVRGGVGDDGLLQRFQLAVFPDLKPDWKYTDNAISGEIEHHARATFERLHRLDAGSIDAEMPMYGIPFLHFDDDAQEMFAEWQTGLMTRLRASSEPACLESHFGKYPGTAARLALVFHLVEVGSGPVGAIALGKALDWLAFLEAHARRLYAAGIQCELTAAYRLLRKLQDAPSDLPDGFTARDVYRKHWVGMDESDTVTNALDLLTEHRYLIALDDVTGGRPTTRYYRRPS